MIMDKELLFDDGLAAVAATSAHVVDLGVARDLGVGENLYLSVSNVGGADLGAALTFTIEQSDDEAFTAPEDAQVSGIMKVDQPQFAARLQPFGITKRYIRVKYSAAGDTLKVGIVKDINATRAYKSGFTVTS